MSAKKHSEINNKMRIKMKKTALASALLLSTTAFAAQSEEVTSVAAPTSGSATYRAFNTPVNYNFGEIMIGQSEIDDSELEGWTLSGGGEGMINENWIYDLYYTGNHYEYRDYDLNFNSFSVGAMYRFPVLEKLDLVVGGDLVLAWSESGTGDNDTTSDVGYGLKSSLRYGFTENFEGKVGARYAKYGEITQTDFNGSVTFYPAPNFGIGATYGITKFEGDSGDGLDSTTVGGFVRFNF